MPDQHLDRLITRPSRLSPETKPLRPQRCGCAGTYDLTLYFLIARSPAQPHRLLHPQAREAISSPLATNLQFWFKVIRALMMLAMEALETIRNAALRLPPEERAQLLRTLESSFSDRGFEPDVADAWEQEIARRVQSVLDGTAVVIPADEARRLARERLAVRRG